MNTLTTFYFNKGLKYIIFIQEATKLLEYNTRLGCLCIPVAHIMWFMYKIKENRSSIQVAVTVDPKNITMVKVPSCQSYWILHEHTKNISSCPVVMSHNIEKIGRKALGIIYKTSTDKLPSDFDYTLVLASENPINALGNMYTFKSSRIVIETDFDN